MRLKNLKLSFATLFVSLWAFEASAVENKEVVPNIASDPEKKTQGVSVREEVKKSGWETFKQRARIRTFSEFMTPSTNNHDYAVPNPDGTELNPTNIFSIAWMDYEVAEDTKVVYWQRFNTYLPQTPTAGAFDTVLRNPRFALRKVNVFKNPNLTTTYDLYVQPGMAPEASLSGRTFEFGFRSSTSYAFPKSKWNVGLITESTISISDHATRSANFYGWLMPWTSYDLSKTVATQHYFSLNFEHLRGTQGLQLDTPMPYIQNGIGLNFSPEIFAAVFINNYVQALPTLANTWASVWLSLSIL